MRKILLLSFLILLISCQKEGITPEHPIKNSEASKDAQANIKQTDASLGKSGTTSQESAKNSNLLSMSGSYTITDYQINDPNPVKDAKLIGTIVNEIIGFIISVDGDFEVDIDPIGVDLSEYDLSIIKIAKIKKINISISNPEEDKKSRLDFIKEFNLDLVKMKRKEERTNLINITEKSIREDGCGVQCIEISLADINLMDLITDTKELLLRPKLSIKKAPKKEFKVDVNIEYYLATEKPF